MKINTWKVAFFTCTAIVIIIMCADIILNIWKVKNMSLTSAPLYAYVFYSMLKYVGALVILFVVYFVIRHLINHKNSKINFILDRRKNG